MRSTVADYEVIEPLDPDLSGGSRYLCRTPARLDWESHQVMVTEVGLDRTGRPRPALAAFAAASSEHLVTLLELGPDDEPDGRGGYLASEAVTQGSLADPGATQNRPQAVARVGAAALGAHALHESGAAHGAISPKSIFLTDRGAVLGPPRLALASGLTTSVSDWRDLVTVDPNVLLGEAPSRSSDLWALGASLHLVASDRPLYPGLDKDPPVTAVQRVLFTRPEIDPSLPDRLAEVIAACLDPDPAGRPATAEDMSRALPASKAAR